MISKGFKCYNTNASYIALAMHQLYIFAFQILMDQIMYIANIQSKMNLINFINSVIIIMVCMLRKNAFICNYIYNLCMKE